MNNTLYRVRNSGAVVKTDTTLEVTNMDTLRTTHMTGAEFFELFGEDDAKWFLEGAPHMIAVPLN